MDVLNFLNTAGWQWKIGSNSLTIFAPNQDAADYLLDHFVEHLSATARTLNATVFLQWGDTHYRVQPTRHTTRMTSSQILTPSAFVGVFEFTPLLLPVIAEILESPDKHMGLVRIEDNAQLIISAASARQIQTPGEEAVRRKTTEYWLGESLETLHQCYRDTSEQGFEITYTATLNKPKTDETALWGRFTTHFRLIEDDFGVLYRKGELLDFAEIARPLMVR